MFPVKVETRILLNCPHCKLSSRYDTGFLEDAIHEGKSVSCVACGSHFQIVVQKTESRPRIVSPHFAKENYVHNIQVKSKY